MKSVATGPTRRAPFLKSILVEYKHEAQASELVFRRQSTRLRFLLVFKKRNLAEIELLQLQSHKKDCEEELADFESIEKKLRKLLRQQNPQKIVDLFASLKESDRKKLKPICAENYRTTNRTIPIDVVRSDPNPLWPTAQVAFLCVADFSELKENGWMGLPDEKWIGPVFRFRKPKWSSKFVDWLLNANHWVFWGKVRAVVREGVCPIPEDPRYFTGMISGLEKHELGQQPKKVYPKLIADPDLLKYEVWKLFEYEGEPDNSLPRVDRAHDWSGALLRLCHEGLLPRQRLMKSTLSALELGWNQPRSKWLTQFFDSLEPTDKELKSELQTFIDFLSSPIPVTADWAFGHIRHLVDQGLVKDLSNVIEALRPLLLAKPKKTVQQTLKFLNKVASDKEKLRSEICLVIAESLAHEKADVQQTAFELIQQFGVPTNHELSATVRQMEPLLAASLKKNVMSWLEQDSSVVKDSRDSKKGNTKGTRKRSVKTKLPKPNIFEAGFRISELSNQLVAGSNSEALEIPAREIDAHIVPRLHSGNQVEPIHDMEELLEVCGRVLEDDSLVEDGERAINAIARFADQMDAENLKLAGPLKKRAKSFLGKRSTNNPFAGVSISSDIAGLILIWTNSKPVDISINWDEIRIHIDGLDAGEVSGWFHYSVAIYFLCYRSIEIARLLAARRTYTLLSTPTHQRGWIDPRGLVEVVNSYSGTPLESDLILSLLRLAPNYKQEALEMLKPKQKGEWINAVRYALGGTARVGEKSQFWLAASRSRVGNNPDEKLSKLFSGESPHHEFQIEYKKKENRYSGKEYLIAELSRPPRLESLQLLQQPTQLLQTNRVESHRSRQSFWDTGLKPGAVDWVSTIWPGCRDHFFAAGAINLVGNLDWGEAAWHNQRFIQPLLFDDTVPNHIALYCLLCGLASKEPGEHGLATDATIRMIEDGRIGSDNFSKLLATHLPPGLFSMSRLGKRFHEIASISGLHAFVVFRSLERSIASCVKGKLRGVADMLEVLLEFGSQYSIGVSDESLRQTLQLVSGSNKTSKVAKKVLSLSSDDFDAERVIELAIENRVSVIQSWLERDTTQ